MMGMIGYLRKKVKERRAAPKDDLISALIQAEEEGNRLSEDELIAMIFVLLIAGHETTVNLIASGVLSLLEFPDQLTMLRNQPDLLKSAIEELLRYASPIEQATERYAAEDVTLHGVTIRKGEMVLVVLASANRDERQFERPDDVDITRTNNKHVAFGQGVHYCVGAPLARLEGDIAINTLIQRVPNLRLSVPMNALKWRGGLTIRGLESMPVTL
jgi:cytochrome P450 PksS